jgi:hypothetical protein
MCDGDSMLRLTRCWRLLGLVLGMLLAVGCGSKSDGTPDSGQNVLPDGGPAHADSGTPDGGTPDSGTPDGGDTQESTRPLFLPHEVDGGAIDADGASVAVDASGGVHVAYYDFIDDLPMYRYCAGACTDPSQFTGVELPNTGSSGGLALALDPAGHPRLLWQVYQGFVYAACDQDCTHLVNWTTTPVTAPYDPLGMAEAQFALDAQGRPRVLLNSDQYADLGTYLLACDSGCDSAAGWTQTKISARNLDQAKVAIGADGRVRFVAEDPSTATGNQVGLLYAECQDAACSSLSAGVTLPPINSITGDFSLSLTAGGAPRIALFTGELDTPGAFAPNTVDYAWCDTDCGTDPAGWAGADTELPLGGAGGALSLALDPQGLPRLAVTVSRGMGFAWCDADCTGASGTWTLATVDDASILPTDALPAGCTYPGWFFGDNILGTGVSLALGPTGNPSLAYDASQTRYCAPNVETVMTWPRFVGFMAP